MATIYHNPQCSTSRNTLALARHAGLEPTVIEYLQSPPDIATLHDLVARAGLQVRDILRTKEPVYAQLHLEAPELTDEQLLQAVVDHPVLLERPLLVTDKGVRLARPIDTVLDILPSFATDFTKENGDVIPARP